MLTVAIGSTVLGLARPLGAAAAGPVGPVPRSVWLYEPEPAAMPGLFAWIDEVLEHIDPVNRQLLSDSEVRIHVIPRDWRLTDLPGWLNLRGRRLPDPDPGDGYVEARTYDQIRALGPSQCKSGPLQLAIAEEQIVAIPDSAYPTPRLGDLGKNLVHELGHALECGLTDAQNVTLAESYVAARRRPLIEVVGDMPSYTIGTSREYFAEGVVAWFESAQGPSYRRAWLSAHDPALHDLLAQVFTVPPAPQLCNGRRATTVLTSRPFTGTPGDDIIVGSPGDDIINGAGGDDVICGRGGDDTLFGGYGSDQLFGGVGDDTYVGGSGDDVLSESNPKIPSGGADHLAGGPGDDMLAGGSGPDVLVDIRGRDKFAGGAGNDLIDARDELTGQPDLLDGSEGADSCQHDADDQVNGCHPPQPVTPAPVAKDSTSPGTTSTSTTTTIPIPTRTSTTIPTRTTTSTSIPTSSPTTTPTSIPTTTPTSSPTSSPASTSTTIPMPNTDSGSTRPRRPSPLL